MLVPRLTMRAFASAVASSRKEAWNAVCNGVVSKYYWLMSGPSQHVGHTGKTRLMTLRLSRHALIWVTVLL